jgi:predicted nucleotidyltransferase
MLTPAEIDALVRRIVERIQPEKVILFGSYAKGTATINSDLDLLVIQETELPMAMRADDLKPMLSSSLIPVDVHVYTPEEVEEFGKEPFSFLQSVLKSGRTVFESSASRARD